MTTTSLRKVWWFHPNPHVSYIFIHPRSTSSLLTILPFKLYRACECFLSHFALKIRAAACSKFNVTAADIKNWRFKLCRTEETEFCWTDQDDCFTLHHFHALFVFVIALIISIYFFILLIGPTTSHPFPGLPAAVIWCSLYSHCWGYLYSHFWVFTLHLMITATSSTKEQCCNLIENWFWITFLLDLSSFIFIVTRQVIKN